MLEALLVIAGASLGLVGLTVGGLSWSRAASARRSAAASCEALSDAGGRLESVQRELDARRAAFEQERAAHATARTELARLGDELIAAEHAAREATQNAERMLREARRDADARQERAVSEARRDADVRHERALAEALRDAEAPLERATAHAEQQRAALVQEAGAKISKLRHEAATASANWKAAAKRLAAVGLSVDAAPRDPFAPAERAASRRLLQELVAGTASAGAAIVDARGLVSLAAGDPAAAGRLANLAATVAVAEGPLASALCAPISSVSLRDGRFSAHLLRLGRGGRWLGVDNEDAAPAFAMRAAALRLLGEPELDLAAPNAPQVVLSLDDAPDTTLSRKLSHWATRWGATAVTVLGTDGQPRAATERAAPASVVAAHDALTSTLLRLLRDGRYLDDTTLLVRAADDSTLALRAAGESLHAPFIAVLSRSEPSGEALDELAGLVRWHQSADRNPSRAAS